MERTGWKEKDDRTITAMRNAMATLGLDAFVPTKTEHLAYLLNYYDQLHARILWEEMAGVLVVPREEKPFIAGSHSHLAGDPVAGVAPWWLEERYEGGRPGICAWEKAVEVLGKKGLAAGRIGIETKTMPVALHNFLRRELPEATLVPADLMVPRIRFIKTKREIELLSKAAAVALGSMESYMEAIRSGASLEEAQCARAHRAIALGGEWPGGPGRLAWTGGTDETRAWWDAEALSRFSASSRNWRGQPEDAPCFVTHCEGLFQGYFADVAWHEFYRGEPAFGDTITLGGGKITYGQACEDFRVLRRVQSEALQRVRPGMDHVTAKQEIDGFIASDPEAKDRVTNYYIHGIGLEIHEEPVLTGYVPTPIPLDGPITFGPGAVVSSEWFTRWWTVEEPFLMTESGWEPIAELRGVTR